MYDFIFATFSTFFRCFNMITKHYWSFFAVENIVTCVTADFRHSHKVKSDVSNQTIQECKLRGQWEYSSLTRGMLSSP